MRNPSGLVYLSENESQIFQNFREQNKLLFENQIIERFFDDPSNILLFVGAFINRTVNDKRQLENGFRRFFFRIRFTSYLISMIRYCNIDYHRKFRRDRERNVLIYDKPLDEESDLSLGEFLTIPMTQVEVALPIQDPDLFMETIDNSQLFEAFSHLTELQKFVITLSYSANKLDTEIAQILRVSQQAVSKTRAAALAKMKKSFFGGKTSGRTGKRKRKGVFDYHAGGVV